MLPLVVKLAAFFDSAFASHPGDPAHRGRHAVPSPLGTDRRQRDAPLPPTIAEARIPALFALTAAEAPPTHRADRIADLIRGQPSPRARRRATIAESRAAYAIVARQPTPLLKALADSGRALPVPLRLYAQAVVRARAEAPPP